jgi:hypothetical protein
VALPIEIAGCTTGQLLTPQGCVDCIATTYILSPQDNQCRACPDSATCGGTYLVPQPGYWHSHPRSTQVGACGSLAANVHA